MYSTNECPVCSSSNSKVLKTYHYDFPGNDVENNLLDQKYVRLWILFTKVLGKQEGTVQFDVEHCNNCSFIYTNPRYTEEEMALKYQTIGELGSVKKRVGGILNKKNYSVERAKRIERLMSSNYGDLTGKTILDFGGQRGDNLTQFTEKSNCWLLDYEQWDLPKGVEYKGKSLAELSDKVDVILFNHTLEHVVDPLHYVKTLKDNLNKDGLLYVEVPLGAFFWEWRRIKEPFTHVNFFSEKSLVHLFKEAGLETVHLSTSYQKLQNGLEWCLNIVGKNSGKAASNQAGQSASTHRMKTPYYFTHMAADRVYRRLTGQKA